MPLRADDKQAAKFRNALAEFNIGTAPRHVRRDCYNAFLSRVRDNLRFFLVEFGIQNAVRDAALFKVAAEFF